MTLADLHPDAFYSAHDVACVFGIHVDTVYGMVRRGLLRAIRLGARGGKIAFQGRDILAYAEERVA